MHNEITWENTAFTFNIDEWLTEIYIHVHTHTHYINIQFRTSVEHQTSSKFTTKLYVFNVVMFLYLNTNTQESA